MKIIIYLSIFLVLFIKNYLQTSDSLIQADFSNYFEYRNGWITEGIDGPSYRYCDGQKCNKTIIDTFDNGNIKHKAKYIDGKYHGEVLYYYPNGQTKSKGYSEYGNRIGEWKYYFENGNIETIIFYDKDLNLAKKYILYYENGNIEMMEEFTDDLYRLYYYEFKENGDTLVAYYPIEWETKTYVFYEWFENGQLKETGQQRHIQDTGWIEIGTWQWFDENGNLTKEINY